MATVSRPMTADEFLALPDDPDIERELIDGELRERTMAVRSCAQTLVSSNLAWSLQNWQRLQPPPRGWVLTGDAAVHLGTNPSTVVGADLVYFAPEVRPEDGRKVRYVDGTPLLVIEILSPSDEVDDIADKIERYLAAGVPMVLIVETRFSTITVHRPDARPQLFNVDQELTAEPHLPGFRLDLAEVFRDLIA